MKKILKSVMVLLMSLMTSMTVVLNAQQMPDPGFEDWSGAAFDGNAQSQYELAVLYGNDRFFSPNRERMLYWYEQAAENGLPEAMWQMAVLKMLDKDYDEVEKRLKKLSEQSGMFGYMAKAVSYLLEKNALSIENIMGCMENFQSRG